MITHIVETEKDFIENMIKNLAQRYSSRLNVSGKKLETILRNVKIETYQKIPYTVSIAKKTVEGKPIQAFGCSKYNPNDKELGKKYSWNDTKGKIVSINRAYNAFIQEMINKNIFTKRPLTSESIDIKAMVDSVEKELSVIK